MSLSFPGKTPQQRPKCRRKDVDGRNSGPSAYLQSIVALAVVLAVLASPMVASDSAPLTEREDGYYTWVDEEGKYILRTGLTGGPGDEFIAEDNTQYRVVKVDGDIVYAEAMGKLALKPGSPLWQPAQAATTPQKMPPILFYHTHSDESYVPTSGVASKWWGDVYDVGEAIAQELRRRNFPVLHDKSNHNPHDARAYFRSRRTLFRVLRNLPNLAAIVDIHRDAAPREEYARIVEGTQVAQVMIVVGRQNPGREGNMQFAQNIKALGDKEAPGIVKGIFRARGNYNQDLGPRTILLEFGAHMNTKEEAIRATEFFADAIALAVYGTRRSTPKTTAQYTPEERRSYNRSLLVLLALFAVAIGAFIYINKQESALLKRLRQGLSDALPSRNKDKDDDQS